MKILFISSDYNGIYEHFELWIISELRKHHEVIVYQMKGGLRVLKSLEKSKKPDVAIALLGFKLPITVINWLKTQQIKTAVWFTEDPYYMDQTAELSQIYDFVFTIDSAAQEFYKKNGNKNTYQLPLATEPEVFKPIENIGNQFRSDICIIGFPYPDRIQYIQLLLQNTNYNITVVGKWKKAMSPFHNHPRLFIYDKWVEPSVVANFYNGAQIVLNTHRPFNLKQNKNQLGIKGKTINNRTYDVAACGSFQLIEYKIDLPNHFIENEEIVSFKSEQELLEKVDYYMQCEVERDRIATNARKRVLENHTFKHRLDKMLTIISHTIL